MLHVKTVSSFPHFSLFPTCTASRLITSGVNRRSAGRDLNLNLSRFATDSRNGSIAVNFNRSLVLSPRQTNFSKERNMKTNVGGLCLLMTLAISLLAAPIYADQAVALKRNLNSGWYDVRKEVTLQGTVESVVKNSAVTSFVGAHLMVSTAQGTVDASIGNHLVAGRYAMEFTPGQSVKLTGMMIEVNHHSVFAVRTLQTGDRTVTVRSQHGFLVSPAAKTRLTGVSSTGGAR
jgi:hypothetical protein